MRVPRSVVIVIAATQAFTACYNYAPILATPSDVGTSVRLRLTDAGSLALAPLIGTQIESMDGRLVSAADTSFVLGVTQTENRSGVETTWRGEQVTVPRAAIARVERRELSRGRSWALGAIVVGAVAILGRATGTIGGSGGRPGDGTGPRPH